MITSTITGIVIIILVGGFVWCLGYFSAYLLDKVAEKLKLDGFQTDVDNQSKFTLPWSKNRNHD